MERRARGEASERAQKLIIVALTFAALSAVASPSIAHPSLARTSVSQNVPGQNVPAQTTNADGVARVRRMVLVSIPDRKLAVIEGGNVLDTFPVAVGAAWTPSPTGEFQIMSRVANPWYYHRGSVVPSGKDNPVGTRWLGLSRPRYGIHGTNAPLSIGHAASHGCIRLRNRDVERLVTMLRVGDSVEIRGERDEQVARVFGTAVDDSMVAEADVSAGSIGQ